MFFDHKTDKTTGKLHRYTKEEIEAMDKAVRDGKAVSTKHLETNVDWFKGRDVEIEIKKAEELAKKDGYAGRAMKELEEIDKMMDGDE